MPKAWEFESPSRHQKIQRSQRRYINLGVSEVDRSLCLALAEILDHKNGIRNDDRVHNLRFVCRKWKVDAQVVERQTRDIQSVVLAWAWEFDSPPEHQKLREGRSDSGNSTAL